MLDRRDFDEWFAREQARNPAGPLGADARHWAEAGFMAAARLMSQALRTQKHVADARKANMREVHSQTAALLKRAGKW